MPERRALLVLLFLVLALGTWLRMPREQDRRKGVDEAHYERYINALDQTGVLGWPSVHAGYIEEQKRQPHAFLPPTRVLFLGSAKIVHALGVSALESIRVVSCAAGIAMLLIGTAFAWRNGGPGAALGVGALLACAPLLIHLSHRALIDGFFALWATVALWGFWESVRAPNPVAAPLCGAPTAQSAVATPHRGWLALYGVGLAAMVLTKENAAFAFIALVAIIALNRWLKVGSITREFLVVTVVAPALGAAVLIVAAGGIGPLLEAYRLNVEKSVILPYAIATGDGPWHRYLLDFILVSPAVTLLAVAAIGATPWTDPAKRCLVVFLLVSYAVMQVRYGMNMRYGAMWALPMCWLAFTLLGTLAARFAGRWRTPALALAVAIVCALELHSYRTLFVVGKIYDPVAGALTQPLKMWKP
ncbi:MAG: phospholipid carrier-dependent glycosyltransferase [Chthoniobacteraceae bacterium]